MTDQMEAWIQELLELDTPEEALTDKQSRILQSAIEIFAEKGYAAASTNEIAKRAGVAEGTIFRHYKSKQELLFSIIGPTMVKFISSFAIKGFEKVLDPPYGSLDQFLRLVLRNRLDFFRKNPRVVKILLQEIPFQHELREQFIVHVGKIIVDKFRIIYAHYQEKGELIPIPTDSAIRFLASSFMGFLLTHMVLFENDEREYEEADRFVDYALYGLSTANRPTSI